MIEHRFLLHNKEWVLALPNCAEKPSETQENGNQGERPPTVASGNESQRSYDSEFFDSEDDTFSKTESAYSSKIFNLYRQQFEEEMLAGGLSGRATNKKYSFNQNLYQL